SGSVLAVCRRDRYLTSRATPTTDNHCTLASNDPNVSSLPLGYTVARKRATETPDNHCTLASTDPNVSRLPIGSSLGQKRAATLSLTMTADAVGISSLSRNVRPATSGMRSASKNPAETRCTHARGRSCAVNGPCPSTE